MCKISHFMRATFYTTSELLGMGVEFHSIHRFKALYAHDEKLSADTGHLRHNRKRNITHLFSAVLYIQDGNDLISERLSHTSNYLAHCVFVSSRLIEIHRRVFLSLRNRSHHSVFQLWFPWIWLLCCFPRLRVWHSFLSYVCVCVRETGLDQATWHFSPRLTDTLRKPCQPVR